METLSESFVLQVTIKKIINHDICRAPPIILARHRHLQFEAGFLDGGNKGSATETS